MWKTQWSVACWCAASVGMVPGEQYRVKLGKLRAQEQLSLADMKQKAGCFLSPVVEERQLCGRFPIIL